MKLKKFRRYFYIIISVVFPKNSKQRLLFKIVLKGISKPKFFLKNLSITNLKKFFYYFITDEPVNLEKRIERKISKSFKRISKKPLIEFNKNITLEKIKNIEFSDYAEPLVSIIIPVLNKWQYTYNCLLSLKNNTSDDISYEIITIDNGSADETSEMLKRIKNIKVISNKENMGFAHSCNMGIKIAKGKYVLFLNNDTIIKTNWWLKSMVDLIENNKQVGAVGAKLLYPDGTLQEAGGVVFDNRNYLACNYGRYDNPDKWEYNYIKEVDYCSGACLLVRKDLLNKVNGFDTKYFPAYCEDTDLCFKVRELGYKIVYQPKAEIIHFEGITAGTDESTGVKKFQKLNMDKFYKKWHSVLEKEQVKDFKELFLARDRSQKKKILLFIDHSVPTWDQDGGSFVTFNYLNVLLHMGFKIIFWPDEICQPEFYIEHLQQMGIEVVYETPFKKYIKKYGKYIDIVFIARPHIAIKYIDLILKYSSRAKIFYIAHDLHFLREKRRAEIETENKNRILKESRKFKKMEFYIISKSDKVLLFSPVEKEIVLKENPTFNVEIIPGSILSPNRCIKGFKERKDIMFLGGFFHKPNEDGVLWFVNDIFPFIKEKIPDVKFIIVGSNPTEKIIRLSSLDILVTGFVEDIAKYFQDNKVFVAPLRYGAGFKIKIAQALSYGIPVITTSIGAEGMGLKNRESALIGDTPEEFARDVIDVYTNEELWTKLSHNGVEHVKNNYTFDVARKKIEEILKEVF